jgi:hypothetical protein
MKLQDLYEAKMLKNKEQIEKWLDSIGITSYTVHSNLTVDVNGDLALSGGRIMISSLPCQFGSVTGSYYSCPRFTTLRGSPQIVGGDVFIEGKHLTSLEGAPQKVEGSFQCACPKITSLVGGPKVVRGFYSFNVVTLSVLNSLVGLPTEITGVLSLGVSDKPFAVLDILNISHLWLVEFYGGNSEDLHNIASIVSRYLKHPYGNKRIIDCQSELIDSEYEDWAEFS